MTALTAPYSDSLCYEGWMVPYEWGGNFIAGTTSEHRKIVRSRSQP